jgi:hypothetical protein
MRTYYQDDLISVDSHVIAVGRRQYRLDGLRQVWLERGGFRPIVLLGTLLSAAAALAAAVGMVAAIVAVIMDPRHPGGQRLPTLGVWGFLFASPLLLGLLLLLMERVREHSRRPYLLCGNYLGEVVLLYSTTNYTRWGQVARAVTRAMDAPHV